MRLGIVTSVIIVLAVAVFVFFASRGVADSPTEATDPETLEPVALPPPSLPPMFAMTAPEASVDEAYLAAVGLADAHEEDLLGESPPAAVVEELIDLLIEGMRAGQVTPGLLDDQVPVEPMATPEFGVALEVIPAVVLDVADSALRGGQRERATLSAQSVWALGQRLFESSVRLHNRHRGLVMMIAAAQRMSGWTPPAPELEAKLAAWAPYLDAVSAAWEPKIEIVWVVRPHIGDLVRLAREEKDVSVRIEAVLRLGPAKFAAGNRGNLRAINATIEEAKRDPHPLVAEAGRVAEAYTREQVQRLR